MSRSPTLKTLPADPVRHAALVGGLVSLPFMIATVRSGSVIDLTPVLYGGLLAGYVYDGPVDDRSRVGDLIGLIGMLPVVWTVAREVLFVVLEMHSVRSTLFGVGVALGLVGSLFAIGIILALIGVRIGDWVSSKAGRTQPTTAVQ